MKPCETIFLDAGNTLLYLDLPLIRARLGSLDFPVALDALARAEARARVILDAHLTRGGGSTEGLDTRRFWVEAILGELPQAPPRPIPDLTTDLLAWIERPEVWLAIWNRVPGHVPRALARLQDMGLHLFVVSNSDGTVEDRLDRGGIRQYLDGVVDSGVIGIEKPDPRIFEHALELAGSDPGQCLHVGDIYSVDVLGARSAGIEAVLIDPFGDWGDVDCERVRDISELAEWIGE